MILDYLFEFLLAWVLRHFKAWRRNRLVVRVQDWPQASGRGLGAHAKSSNAAHPIWATDITYSYVVDGEYYSGFVSLPADDEAHAEGLALGWNDRAILVRYLPNSPTESTLLLEDQNQPTAILNG
jgi:hypothetical protein